MEESEDVVIDASESESKAREEERLVGDKVLLAPKSVSMGTGASDGVLLFWSRMNTKEIASARTSATTATRSTFNFLRLIMTASSGAMLPRINDASKIKFSAPLVPMDDTLLPSSLTMDARGTRMMLSGAVGSGRANQVSYALVDSSPSTSTVRPMWKAPGLDTLGGLATVRWRVVGSSTM